MEDKKTIKWYKNVKKIYKFLLKILYSPEVIGSDNIPDEGAIIFAGNHRNAIDPTILMSATNRIVHFMAKKEAFKGLHGIMFKNIGLIQIDRKKSNQVSVRVAERILNEGGTIGIFPEGTRNKTKERLLPFKKGAVVMAQKTKAKIVPFAITGEYKLFKKSLKIKVGKPVDVSNLSKEDANEYLKNEILKLIKG